MEEFDDDDFSDLYADVEVQASSAINAMHRLTGMRPEDDKIFDNATRGGQEVRDRFSGTEIAGRNRKLYEHDAGCEDVGGEQEEDDCSGSKNLPMESTDIRSSESESEDDMDNDSDDGYKQKFDGNYDNDKYDNRISNVDFGIRNKKIEEDEKPPRGIDGNEKGVNGRDCNSRRKDLECDSLNSKKRRVDEINHRVHKTCKKRDVDVGNDKDLCFNKAIKDNKPNFGRKYGGPKIASESSRHRHACNTAPLGLDRCGSVQISDSVEDNHHEVSDCDSDEMAEVMGTSDDTRKRNASSISGKLSSTVEPESSRSGCSHRGQGSSSPSSSAGLSNKYIEKNHKHAEYPSSRLVRDLQEGITSEYRPSKDFNSRSIKQNTRDGRYCERQRGSVRKHSSWHKKSDDTPYLKSRITREDSYAIDVKHLYNRHVSHGKKRATSFNSNENDMPFYSQSDRFSTYSDRVLPRYRLRPSYLKNQHRNIHPSGKYTAGCPDGYNMSERRNFLDKKSSQMVYETFGDYRNQRRHPVHDNIDGSRYFTLKNSCSAVNQRGSRFIYKGDSVNFRRPKGDYMSPLHDYDNEFVERKYRRIFPGSGRGRDHLDHRCDRNIARDRREMESSGRDKRICDSFLNLENPSYIKTEVDDRRNIIHRPFTFHSSKEHCSPGRRQFPDSSGPTYGVPERKMRCFREEMPLECGRYGTNITTSDSRENFRYPHVRGRQYQQSSKSYATNESIKDDHDEDHFFRRRSHQHSEVFHPREEVYMPRQQNDTMFKSEEPPFDFERISRNKKADDRHAFVRVAELIDEREVNRKSSKTVREEDCNNQFYEGRESIQPHSHAQMHPRYRDSVDRMVVVGRKCTVQSSRITSEAGEDIYHSRHDLVGLNDQQKSKNFEDTDNFNPEKAVLTKEVKADTSFSDKNWQNKFSQNQQDEFLDVEEGQIITEEIHDPVKSWRASEDTIRINDMAASNGNVEKLDDEKIREIMVKMEMRRERFKEPIITSKDCEKSSNSSPDSNVETGSAKLERPARKRRWSGI